MSDSSIRSDLSDILKHLVRELDVPPAKYREAQAHYDAVGTWLNDAASKVARFGPRIYPQGSFALGTVIRPLGDEDYDVDAVCVLQAAQHNRITQKEVKNLIGDRLKENARYREMLDPKEGGRRCWTLRYAESTRFHLDVLPAIPDPDRTRLAGRVPPKRLETGILITDTTTWGGPIEWPTSNCSNPKGYVDWFKERMIVALQKRREEILRERRSKGIMDHVEDVPDYEVRTPLQQVIQLLKRHRDVRYNGDEDKPISIIITTLAAVAYNNEDDLVEAMASIVPKMRAGIEERNGQYWVANPVNPLENFADKWAETPRKRDLFYEWLGLVEAEFRELLTPQGFGRVEEYMSKAYGTRDAGAAFTKFAEARRSAAASKVAAAVIPPAAPRSVTLPLRGVPSLFSVPHRALPPWPDARGYSVSISARYVLDGAYYHFGNNAAPLPKNLSLFFNAETNVPGDFSVFWQVVNTGREAESCGAMGLRGGIFPATTAGRGGLIQKEHTGYTGSHWIECFIVKNGMCVARSGEFVVNVM